MLQFARTVLNTFVQHSARKYLMVHAESMPFLDTPSLHSFLFRIHTPDRVAQRCATKARRNRAVHAEFSLHHAEFPMPLLGAPSNDSFLCPALFTHVECRVDGWWGTTHCDIRYLHSSRLSDSSSPHYFILALLSWLPLMSKIL